MAATEKGLLAERQPNLNETEYFCLSPAKSVVQTAIARPIQYFKLTVYEFLFWQLNATPSLI